MLSRINRFHGYNSLNWVYRNGHTIRDNSLALRYAKNPKRATYRVAVVVSKKTAKSAVTRNRIRRRVYAVISLNKQKIVGNYDLVFNIYSDALAIIPSKDLSKLIEDILRKSGALPEDEDK